MKSIEGVAEHRIMQKEFINCRYRLKSSTGIRDSANNCGCKLKVKRSIERCGITT
jgi:hypothetical protein